MRKFKIALCQIPPASVRQRTEEVRLKTRQNVQSCFEKVALESEPDVIMLPEAWNLPYNTDKFKEFAEIVPSVGEIPEEEKSPSSHFLSSLAKSWSKYIIGGTISELHEDKYYNSCLCFDKDGKIIAKHRKMHLFDVNIPGKIEFRESNVLSPGNHITTFDTPWGIFGVGICYDVRFAELSLCMRLRGAHFLAFPAAFNTTTGPKHWTSLMIARALDTQCYVFACSPSKRTSRYDYATYGHSLVVDPWGKVLKELNDETGVIVQEVDTELVETARNRIPISTQRRKDVYSLNEIKVD